jgi:hypothetical protein
VVRCFVVASFGEVFLVSELGGQVPVLSSLTGRVGVVGGWVRRIVRVDLVYLALQVFGGVGVGWAGGVCWMLSPVRWGSKVGV